MHLVPTVLCGGAGSRLWPVSRALHPKPFIRLEDGHSLLQKAFLRGAALPNVREILTVTNRELYFKIEDELRELNQQACTTSFILEPFGKNTAAAITMAALQLSARLGDDVILLILAADHLIQDQDAFQQAVSSGIELASNGKIVTFGIKPNEPHTGYGYIEATDSIVHRFVEKPSLQQAEEYLSSGRFLWNSGIFLFQARSLFASMEKHCSEILTTTRNCFNVSRQAVGDGFFQLELDAKTFSMVPDVSIDYALMEKTTQVAVVPCDIGWTDVGSWSVLGDLVAPDDAGNRVVGDVLLHETSNCYIQSHDRLVGAVGVENLIVIDTPDALLVAAQSKAQDVKHIYAKLKIQNHDAHKLHRTVYRPWGNYTILEESNSFKIKRIEVKPGGSLSLQMHHHRSEHWIVVSGMAKVTNGDKVFFVSTNESTYIPAGCQHRLENTGVLDLVMIEVQSGEYLGEDDIVRFEDHYGRV